MTKTLYNSEVRVISTIVEVFRPGTELHVYCVFEIEMIDSKTLDNYYLFLAVMPQLQSRTLRSYYTIT